MFSSSTALGSLTVIVLFSIAVSQPSVSRLPIQVKTHQVKIDNKKVDLSAKEFDLLYLLFSNPDAAFTREQIYEAVFSMDGESDDSTIATHIKNIRAKLNSLDVQPITTVWGIGYKWE